MRKLNKFFLTALAAVTSLTASGAKIYNLHIEDASTVTVTVGGGFSSTTDVEIQDGLNVVEVGAWQSVKVKGVPPYQVSKVTDENGVEQELYGGEWSEFNYGGDGEYTRYIEVINLDESRTASCTVNVDDASLVKVTLPDTDTPVTLQNGENTVMFIPGLEKKLEIESVTYGAALYEVRLNGEPVSHSYETYSPELSQDCVIDITAVMPEGNVTVTFEYGEGAEGALIDPKVDGEPAEFVNNTLSVPIGKKFGWSGNPDFCIDGVTVDGENTRWLGPYPYTTESVVKRDVLVHVDAHKYDVYSVTVKCTDPSHIKLYIGAPYENRLAELTGTETVIQVSENIGYLTWQAMTGCKIVSVTCDGELVEDDNTDIMHDGTVIEIESYAIDFNRLAILYIEDLALADSSAEIRGGDDERTVFHAKREPVYTDGYNEFRFADEFNPFEFSIYGYSASWVYIYPYLYVNGEYKEHSFGTIRNVELADGDIVKLFVGTEPTVCHVAVECDSEYADKFRMVRDIIKDVTTDEFEGFDVFQNTQIEIQPLEDSLLEVNVNGAPVEENEDGNFVFTVTPVAAEQGTTREAGVTNVQVKFLGSGIESIETEADAKAVYNLQGIKVADSLENLPAGLYITNGKKVIVK